MSQTSEDNKRIARNTLFLYFRMFLIMGITLYTSRVILRVLGEEDFGIYTVIAGVLALFMSISGSLGNASVRFITYSLGNDDELGQRKVFSSTIIVHLLISLIVFMLSETVGLYLFYHKLVIPPDRLIPAFWAYQYTMVSLIFVFLNLPYVAVLMAHEHMNIYAYISIIDVGLRLAVVFGLLFTGADKLSAYALLLLAVQVIVQVCYWIYCRRHFSTTKFMWVWDMGLLQSIFTYSSWIFIGTIVFTLYTQGLTILLNVFFGPIVNAAQGIAVQVQTAVLRFSENVQRALQPQIILSWTERRAQRLFTLVTSGMKCAYFLMLLLGLPLIFQVDTVLAWWLGDYPDETPMFVVLFIIICLIRNYSGPLMMAVQATSRIRAVELCNCLMLVALVISYFGLKWMGIPVYMVLVINVIADLSMMLLRIHLSLRQLKIDAVRFYRATYLPTIIITLLAVLVTGAVNSIPMEGVHSVVKFIIVGMTSTISVIVLVYTLGLNASERVLARGAIAKFWHKFRH